MFVFAPVAFFVTLFKMTDELLLKTVNIATVCTVNDPQYQMTFQHVLITH